MIGRCATAGNINQFQLQLARRLAGVHKGQEFGVFTLGAVHKVERTVQPGDKVKKGQTLLIVEAMKTMNPIQAPRDGVIQELVVLRPGVLRHAMVDLGGNMLAVHARQMSFTWGVAGDQDNPSGPRPLRGRS